MSKLKAWRESQGWTQQELADRAGYHVQYISAIERGARQAGMGFARRMRDLSEGEITLDDLAPPAEISPSQKAA
ncbi:MAG: helix-turn-helix domain-containing protein [Pseudomonadota bacterium]